MPPRQAYSFTASRWHSSTLDRLTSTDAGFLHQEHRCSHMHIGGVLLLDGPPPTHQEVVDHIRGRLHLIPRLPPETGDATAGYRETAVGRRTTASTSITTCAALPLPSPGSEAQLMQTAARIASQALDRTKPCGVLADRRDRTEARGRDRAVRADLQEPPRARRRRGWDGPAAALFDLSPEPAGLDTAGLVAWQPQPEPSPLEMVLAGARDALGNRRRLDARTLDAAAHPGHTAGTLRTPLRASVKSYGWRSTQHQETPLNVPIGPHRRFAVVRQNLAD